MSYIKDLPSELEEDLGAVITILRFDTTGGEKDFIFSMENKGLEEEYFCCVAPHNWSSKLKENIARKLAGEERVEIRMKKVLKTYMGKATGAVVFIAFV